MVEDEGTPGHHSARVSLRAPRAAIRVETTVNWQSMLGLAMSMAAGLWGGYGFIYIPHSSGKIDPALARILSAYDPGYLVDVLLTHGEVEAVGCSSARRSVLPASARTRKPTRQFKKTASRQRSPGHGRDRARNHGSRPVEGERNCPTAEGNGWTRLAVRKGSASPGHDEPTGPPAKQLPLPS